MKINQVEELTGVTKKNIRFYEEQKLISPQRNPANGYREYSMEDVKQLSRIKLLRKLGIPIESIRKMESGEMKLDDCMIKRVHELKETVQSAVNHCSGIFCRDYDTCSSRICPVVVLSQFSGSGSRRGTWVLRRCRIGCLRGCNYRLQGKDQRN